MKKSTGAQALTLLLLAAGPLAAQKKTFDRADFKPVSASPVNFTPYQKTDFAAAGTPDETPITLPNKKTVKLSEYLRSLNQVERSLASMGFARNRPQATVVASRYKLSTALAVSGVAPTAVAMAAAAPRKMNTQMVARFSDKQLRIERLKTLRSAMVAAANADRINALPNEKFDRTFDVSPPTFNVEGYGVKVVAKFVLKGETDPFVIAAADRNEATLERLMKETNSSYTAGINLTASSNLPELGGLTAYQLDAEFTARSNKTQKHSSKARLQIMQQVLINENRNDIAQDNYSFNHNRALTYNKLIGAADIFTYGLNLFMPVDFYLAAGNVGANIDVELKRTGITGTMGPRASQSILLETSLTELLGAGGELIGNTVDAGVGGELRLIEGGLDYGFSAGLGINNGRIVFINDMYGEANLSLLRGRLFTYYQYPVFKCGTSIITRFKDLSCWELRRVENELFNSGSAVTFSKKVVDEDKSEYVSW
ncbi:hypothetical protein [Flaviaesturariibacter amylovorans]|uniref:DUF5723 domain-containing protein n=1 Tax=Flaviaesturariibacter amylovorans TaxID=1084520 RepID=A0ABP8HFC0_9BACT